MKFSTILLVALSAIFVKALDTQVVEGCPKEKLNIVITKCAENEVLLKNSKKIFYYEPPKEGEDEICDRTMNLKPTGLEECAPVQLFDEPAITTITSFSNDKFNISKYLDITCSLEKDSSKSVKDCKGWKINENSLTIGDVTTTDKNLVGETVKASITLNIKVDTAHEKKIAVFSYNGENGFQFSINNENKLTMSAFEFDVNKTYGYAFLLNNNSTTLTWSFMSKLKSEDSNKVFAIIDGIAIEGASVITPEEAKKQAESKPTADAKTTSAGTSETITDKNEKPTATDKEEKATTSGKEKPTATDKEEEATGSDKEKPTATDKEEKATSSGKEKPIATDKEENATTSVKEKPTETNSKSASASSSSNTTSTTTLTTTSITTSTTSSSKSTTNGSSKATSVEESSVSVEHTTLENPTITIEGEKSDSSNSSSSKSTSTSTSTSTSNSTSTSSSKSTSTSTSNSTSTSTTTTTSSSNSTSTSTTTTSTSSSSSSSSATVTKSSSTTGTIKGENSTAVNEKDTATTKEGKSKETTTVKVESTVASEKSTVTKEEKKTSSISSEPTDTNDGDDFGFGNDLNDIKEVEEDDDQENSGHGGMIIVSAGAVVALLFYMKSKKPRFTPINDDMRQVEEEPENERFDYFAEEGFLDDYDEVDEMYDDEIGINVEGDNDFDNNDNNHTNNQNLI